MKVIQIMDNLGFGGGVNSFVYDLCYALKEQGCDVSLIGILSNGYNENPEIAKLKENGIRVECIGASSKKDALIHCVSKLKDIIDDISNKEETICNLHLKLSVLMGVLATKGLKNIKCVETYHSEYHHYHLQCWLCSHFIKKYITVSNTAREEMHKRFSIPYRKIISIPNGVSRKKIRELANIEEYKHEDGKLHIVSVGRLSYQKNFKVPVEAFIDVCNKNITYTLVGGGPQEDEIRAIASRNKYIHILGTLSRKNTLKELAKADIVVMPSLWEGRSILQLEALALDKPMIISDVPALREPFGECKLKQNETWRRCQWGYIVKTNNEQAYKDTIDDYFNLVNNGGSEAFDVIKNLSNESDIKNTAKKYIKVYLEML